MSCLDSFFDQSTGPEYSNQPFFGEIHEPISTEPYQAQVEVFVCSVDPKLCGTLLKQLPRVDCLSHLKRVKSERVIQSHHGNSLKPISKKAKYGNEIQVLLSLACDDAVDVLKPLIDKFNLRVQRALLPSRPAESKDEQESFNKIWPTIYFHRKSVEHKQSEFRLTTDDLTSMVIGMEEAIIDGAAVIMNPAINVVVSRASEELTFQEISVSSNPLASLPILAIQGVSRKEREAALRQGVASSTFKEGQYLCTGYDIFLLQEPSMFEAMALVHSRIRRVVFGIKNSNEGGLGGSGQYLHCLTGTNHRYRVFHCLEGTDLWDKCNTTLRRLKKA